MASLCRSPTVIAALRSAASRSKTLFPNSSSTRRTVPLFRRSVMASLGSVESLMPLHTAIASARLKSIIAADSSCWSLLSQGCALPL